MAKKRITIAVKKIRAVLATMSQRAAAELVPPTTQSSLSKIAQGEVRSPRDAVRKRFARAPFGITKLDWETLAK